MLTFVGWLDRPLGWRIERVPWLDLLFILPAWLVAMDVAQVSRKTTELPFTLHLPKIAWHPTFRHVTSPVYNYDPPGAWAGPSLPAMMSNDGFLGCYSVPDRAEPHGAIAFDDSRYRGEARFDKGPGHAEVTRWSPNGAEVVYAGASPGALLVYNMNYDPSWNANGRPALEVDHAVAVRVSSASGIVRFRYFPRTLPWGIGLLAITVAAVVTDWRSRRRFSSTL